MVPDKDTSLRTNGDEGKPAGTQLQAAEAQAKGLLRRTFDTLPAM